MEERYVIYYEEDELRGMLLTTKGEPRANFAKLVQALLRTAYSQGAELERRGKETWDTSPGF